MSFYNRLELIGPIAGAGPKLMRRKNGKLVAKFYVVIPNGYSDTGMNISGYLPCTLHSSEKALEWFAKTHKKGSHVHVAGVLIRREWTVDGHRHGMWWLECDKVTFLEWALEPAGAIRRKPVEIADGDPDAVPDPIDEAVDQLEAGT